MKYCPLCGKEYAEGTHCEKDGGVLIRTQPETELMIGQVLKGSYRIEEQIGQGGMAAVFKGVQMPLERDVAIKVLLPTLQSTPSMIQRFFQEAKLLCHLNHPNVVQIIDFGNTESGLVFMVMEFLRGHTLLERIPAGGLDLEGTVSVMQQVCDGVGAAHRKGLVHRDLKPENIFVVSAEGERDQVKILDFGIARAMEDTQNQTRLTQTGVVMGTPGFLAPEQIGGASEADARSDIYALGAILYLMLTGQRPYQGATPNSILIQQLQEPPNLDLGILGTSHPLARVIDKAMDREPAGRYQSAAELFADLAAVAKLDQGSPSTVGGGVAPTVIIPERTPKPSRAATDPTLRLDESPAEGSGAATPGGGSRRWLPAAALAAAVVLLAAVAYFGGFLGGDGGGDGHGGDATTAARGVSEDAVLVGMSAAFSGAAKELGRDMRAGIETCFSEANARGGVHGRELKLVALDDGYEPSRAVANMAELLFERGTFAVLGNVGTPTAEVTLPLALEQKSPFFGALTGADLLRRDPPDPYVFNYRASYAAETAALVQYFLDVRGYDAAEIAVFAQEDGFGDAGYRGVSATLEARGYDDSVPRIGYRRNRTDVTDSVDELLRDHPQTKALILVATYRAAADMIRQVKDRGAEMAFANLSFVGSRALAEELSEAGPRYAEGVIVSQVVPHYASDSPGVARYRRALAEHSPAEQPGFVSLEGYLACRLFVEAVDRSGPGLGVDGFLEAAASIRNFDLGVGAALSLRPQNEQDRPPVWGTQLDADATYRELTLSP
ncbi:MAG: ABC transporter substrate-binding protein [Acidobacteriota bacterium]